MTVPYQRIVNVHKRTLCAPPFVQCELRNLSRAYKDLDASGAILYLYFLRNQNGFSLEYSPAAIRNELGMAPSTSSDQWNKMIKKGYLVPKSEGSNIYDFYETPIEEENLSDNLNVVAHQFSDGGFENAEATKEYLQEISEIRKKNSTAEFVF